MKQKKLIKGTGRAVLLSILIHAGLFLIAATLIVFTVVKKTEIPFDAPKITERPKMDLKKPKVRIQKNSRPPSVARIVTTKVSPISMPSVDIPALAGMGDGLGGVGQGFIDMPELEMPTLLGSGYSIGSDLEGSFYDFKRDRNGRDIPYSQDGYRDVVRRFIKAGWKPSVLAKYYRSPRTLYATTLVVPTVLSEIAPRAFGEEVEGNFWMVHYKGKLVCQRDITFRFVGSGDEMLVVRVNGKIAMAVAWSYDEQRLIGDIWRSQAAETDQYWMGNQTATMGDWITLKAGEAQELEILGTDNGGQACLMLAIEEKNAAYERRKNGAPIFPAFKTADLTLDQMDIIYRNMVPTELSLTNGPIFNDFEHAKPVPSENPAPTMPEIAKEEEAAEPVRIWTLVDGTELEGTYACRVGSKIVITTRNGKMESLPLSNLSHQDRIYTELLNPPTMKLGVSQIKSPKYSIVNESRSGVAYAYSYTFTGNVKLTGLASYNHELTAEFFAVGSEIFGDKYQLLDRQSSRFMPTRENQASHSFTGPAVELPNFVLEGLHRGVEYFGYLITVTDERGNVIAHKTNAKWLVENLDTLKQLPVGRFMDRTCNRVFPTGPKSTRY